MTFVAVLLALVLDQARRPGADAMWHGPMRTWAAWVQRQFDAGHPRQGWLVWGLAVGVPVLAVTGIHLALAAVSGLLAFAWTAAVLYATLGFRQFSHYFTAIRAALESGDEARARALFAEWSGAPAVDWPREELLRRVIAQAVLCSHRHVLGVLGWFVVLAGLGLGPAGAALYRAASWLAQQWPLDAQRTAAVSEAVARATARAWCGIDALPARLTVLGFAVVGHFEEALERWRAHATAWREPSDALLLSVAGGAMQMRLWPRNPEEEGGRTEGTAPQLAHLASTVGLVWRSVVLWLLVLALALLVRIF